MRGGTTINIAVLAFLIIVLVGTFFVFIYSGIYNIAATDSHSDVLRWVLNTIKVQSIRTQAAGVELTLPTDAEALQRGYHLYQELCVMCHGAPGVQPSAIGQGLNPKSSLLIEKAKRYSQEETFWIIENGVKLTGMPGFGPTHRREDLLAIAAFVEKLPEISEQEYMRMSEAQEGEQETESN
jgi:mono/diheme cytochrome c family protein